MYSLLNWINIQNLHKNIIIIIYYITKLGTQMTISFVKLLDTYWPCFICYF